MPFKGSFSRLDMAEWLMRDSLSLKICQYKLQKLKSKQNKDWEKQTRITQNCGITTKSIQYAYMKHQNGKKVLKETGTKKNIEAKMLVNLCKLMLVKTQWSRKQKKPSKKKIKKKIQLDISFSNFIKDTERNVKGARGRKLFVHRKGKIKNFI